MRLICVLLPFLLAGISHAWTPGVDSQPNIIYILADDLGYNDVSWKNENILSPNMEAYANLGVKFDQYYVQPGCSPSRSALLTGYYPIHTGFNTGALGWRSKQGLELKYATLAEELGEVGYVSHMVGKWHLGWCNNVLLPFNRGFTTFNGILHSGTDHYYYGTENPAGYDLWANDELNTADNGTYSSVMYTSKAENIIRTHDQSSPLFLYAAFQNIHTPLEVPDDYLTMYRQITRDNNWTNLRKQAAAMVTTIDDAFASIVAALDEVGMLDNTVIVFSSDNGGQPTAGGASNYPLRGAKNTWWEGGIRVPSWIYSPLFDESIAGTTSDCLFHISDWFTTLLAMAGGTPSGSVDGVDQWDAIMGTSCPRSDILHNIEEGVAGIYRMGDYKLIWGYPGELNGWYFQNGSSETDDSFVYTGADDYYLFDLSADPNEEVNLAENTGYADVLATMVDVIDTNTSLVVSFSTFGRITEEEAVVDGMWVLGACSDTTF